MTERGGWSGVAWGVAALAAVVVVVRLLGGSGSPTPTPVKVAAGSGAGTVAAAGGEPQTRALGPYVHVAGLVRRPGLYRLPPETRVAEAVERAGGALARADLGAINLAARVVDGQQVVVPARRAAGGALAGGGGVTGAGSAAAPLGLGTATVAELERLDGIGPTLAARIVEHRRELGGFASLEQLDDVEGIGEARLAALREVLAP